MSQTYSDALVNDLMARNAPEQSSAVRSQEDLARELTDCEDVTVALSIVFEAEARGAAEQRRKDAEEQEPVGYTSCGALEHLATKSGKRVQNLYGYSAPSWRVPLYIRPANVAAMEARIAELEGENSALEKRVMNAAETLLSIETPCMEGDNFAVTICSHFEDCEGEPCDNGWYPKATEAYEEIKTAIARHFRAALTREGGV